MATFLGSVKSGITKEDEYNNLMDEIPSTLKGFVYLFESGQVKDVKRLDRTLKNLQLKVSEYKKRLKESN
jgi:hypothetical protein